MIEVRDVVKYYGNFLAVDKISFYIEKGEIIGLLGPNGAGKSTTIRMICGYLAPDQGSITVDGVSSDDDPLYAKKSIGYLPESAPLYDEMLVFDYLSHVAQIREIPSENILTRIKEVAGICGLVSVMHKNIGELSKGYRQRVGLAHALIGNPDILVLDEPTSGLDPNQIVEIRSLIKEIGKTKTVILCSHILSEVEATCDRVIIINQGKIVADNSKEALKHSYQGKNITVELDLSTTETGRVKEVLTTVDGISDMVADSLGGLHDSQDRVRIKIHYESERDLRPTISKKLQDQGWLILEFHQEEKSLENIFRELTSRSVDPLVEK